MMVIQMILPCVCRFTFFYFVLFIHPEMGISAVTEITKGMGINNWELAI